MNKLKLLKIFFSFFLAALWITAGISYAMEIEIINYGQNKSIDLVNSLTGIACLVVFTLAYILVMIEELINLRKSKPVVIAAGIIWILIGFSYLNGGGDMEKIQETIKHSILEFAELFFFLLVAMTYINSLGNRNVFEKLRSYLVSLNLNYRKLFWITGIISFFLSPIADNLTTALVMGAVILSVGSNSKKFVALGFVNVVVAANAGGAFSPFGDITTLMVWQKGIIDFWGFFALFIPSVVNYIVPAFIMQFFVPDEKPASSDEKVEILYGGKLLIFLFLLTIATAVSMHSLFHIPPVMGMMMGLGYLMFFSFFVGKKQKKLKSIQEIKEFDVFKGISDAEWDTLFFFFGIILSVGGLALIGYLNLASVYSYQNIGITESNILVGILSAIIDNIPVMFAVLTMNPEMNDAQWLLTTLTAGVGGSMLSIGSAAGVALMGQSKGKYTFFSHLRWTPVIALGYFASIYVHILLNSQHF